MAPWPSRSRTLSMPASTKAVSSSFTAITWSSCAAAAVHGAVWRRRLETISAVDAFGPDIDPRSTWYDEMLVSDDTVAVIGYSYQAAGLKSVCLISTRAGNLRYRSTYHLRSNDYYSSRKLCEPPDWQQAHLLQPALSVAVRG